MWPSNYVVKSLKKITIRYNEGIKIQMYSLEVHKGNNVGKDGSVIDNMWLYGSI